MTSGTAAFSNWELVMANSSRLASMGIEELIKLRDDIGRVVSQKTAELKKQLQRLQGRDRSSLQTNGRRKGPPRKGRKLPAKYRDPNDPSLVWAGRGALPRWMQERIAAGAKKEDFLVGQPVAAAKSRKKRPMKRSVAKRARKRKSAA
jgi:DNA-binding protein H-NS